MAGIWRPQILVVVAMGTAALAVLGLAIYCYYAPEYELNRALDGIGEVYWVQRPGGQAATRDPQKIRRICAGVRALLGSGSPGKPLGASLGDSMITVQFTRSQANWSVLRFILEGWRLGNGDGVWVDTTVVDRLVSDEDWKRFEEILDSH